MPPSITSIIRSVLNGGAVSSSGENPSREHAKSLISDPNFSPPALPSFPPSSITALERYTTDNGLPSNGIKGLQWDEQTGFLWIATEAGVTRYNGADFLTFSKANTPELFSERMLLMLKNRSGKLYTVDEAGNIFFIMQNKLQFLGNVTLDTRSSTARLSGIGLSSSGQLFRQSAQQPPGDFGFNCTGDLMIPISDSNALIYHVDTVNKYVAGLYDYRIGKKNRNCSFPSHRAPSYSGLAISSIFSPAKTGSIVSI